VSPLVPASFDAQAAEFDRRVGFPEGECRAIHLLPLDLVAREVFRVGAPGAVCVLGWVERQPESIKARMARVSLAPPEIFGHLLPLFIHSVPAVETP
jgi:hypothetical protein